jgi:hypothetical protein
MSKKIYVFAFSTKGLQNAHREYENSGQNAMDPANVRFVSVDGQNFCAETHNEEVIGLGGRHLTSQHADSLHQLVATLDASPTVLNRLRIPEVFEPTDRYNPEAGAAFAVMVAHGAQSEWLQNRS